MCKEYNGHENYQTWNVSLWMDNSGMHAYWLERAETGISKHDLADEIKEWAQENNPVGNEASMWNDLMGHALGAVAWDDIAEGYIEDLE